jgi:hypothetical protein
VRCAQCQADAPDGSRFCPSCGRPLEAVTALLGSDRTATSMIGLDQAITAAATAHRDWDATRLADPATVATAGSGRGSTDHDSFAPGAVVADRYRIERQLGKGGMGVVYLQYDERLKVPVPLKCLPPSLARDPRRLEQFHNEVRLARLISHPNVCRGHDRGRRRRGRADHRGDESDLL